MERALEFKDICGYLPYKLKTVDKHQHIIDYICYHYTILSDWERTKPILRPLSDLYKPVMHNGQEIIPIVECAKIHAGTYEWTLNEFDDAECRDFFFGYNKKLNSFYSGYLGGKSAQFCLVWEQYKLFDYLNELKIDYRGLIDAGLAVSVYDLNINPYK